VSVYTFADVGLAAGASDTMVWQLCQNEEYVLLTANRNEAGADSLEATIRTSNTRQSLPVFTLANAAQVRTNKAYADRVAVRLLEFFLDIEQYRGVGRLYVP
jgi:hypothetical protein